MEKFNVLPTDERFKNLTSEQFNYIFTNMELDIKEQERANKGLKNTIEDDDDSWFYEDSETFEPLKEEHDEEDLARQVDNLLTETDRKKKQERLKANEVTEEDMEMYQEHQETVREYMNKRLEELDDEVEHGKTIDDYKKPEDMTTDDINSAINLFNDDDDDSFYI